VKEIEYIDRFIGATLLDARRLLVVEDEWCFCSGIELTFTAGGFVVYAATEDDSLDISVSVLGEDEDPCLPGKFERADTSQFARHFGQRLANVWACFPKANYCDALDFGFGDLCLPNVKVLSLVSEIIELRVCP